MDRIILALVKDGTLAREPGHHYSILTLLHREDYEPSNAVGVPPNVPPLSHQCPAVVPPLSTQEKQEHLEHQEHSEKQDAPAIAAAAAKPKRIPKFTDEDMATAEWIWGKIDALDIKAKKPNLESWANDVRLIREQDKETDGEIRKVFSWANKPGCWWSTRLLSPAKLRKHWVTLNGQMKDKTHGTRTAGPGQKYDPDAGEDDQPAGLFRR